MAQRFISGTDVFDTVKGMRGTIQKMDLDSSAIPPLAPLYTGAYFVVLRADATLQTFTDQGKQVDHSTGVPLSGITVLTQKEYVAILGAGYPNY